MEIVKKLEVVVSLRKEQKVLEPYKIAVYLMLVI